MGADKRRFGMLIEGTGSGENCESMERPFEEGILEGGRAVRLLRDGIIGQVVEQAVKAVQAVTWKQPKIDFFTRGDGVCPRYHKAYYIYYQDLPFEPIRLCNEKYDADLRAPCPFEYYTFLRMLHNSSR
jgi:hypothetical protein